MPKSDQTSPPPDHIFVPSKKPIALYLRLYFQDRLTEIGRLIGYAERPMSIAAYFRSPSQSTCRHYRNSLYKIQGPQEMTLPATQVWTPRVARNA